MANDILTHQPTSTGKNTSTAAFGGLDVSGVHFNWEASPEMLNQLLWFQNFLLLSYDLSNNLGGAIVHCTYHM